MGQFEIFDENYIKHVNINKINLDVTLPMNEHLKLTNKTCFKNGIKHYKCSQKYPINLKVLFYQ